MKIPLLVAAGAAVSLSIATTTTATTLTLYPGGDTSIRSEFPNQTFGAVPMEVRGGTSPSRAAVRFNLDDLRFQLGGGGVLNSAVLRLHVDDTLDWQDGAAVHLHRIERDWTAVWATWSCPSDSNRLNDLPDCAEPWSGGTVRNEMAAVRPIASEESGWIDVDVTADLLDLPQPGARLGWLLRAGDESIDGTVIFGVSETGYAPRLIVDYSAPFSVDDAFAEAVQFAPSEWDPQVVHGFDPFERIVWRHGPEGTQGFRYEGPDGELAEYVDERGNRTWFIRDASGRTIERRHHYRHAGDWSEKSFFDGEGQLVVDGVDWSEDALHQKLARLGIAPDVPTAPTSQAWSEDENGSINELANGYSRVTIWSSKNPSPIMGEIYSRETSEILGRRMTVTLENTDQGTIARDDWGGWRLYRSDDVGLFSVEDEHGYVLSIERDEQGRPVELWLGELVKVLYVWDSAGRVTKQVVDLRTGEVVMTAPPATPIGQYHQPQDLTTTQPRRRTVARLPPVGTVAEWDEVYPWNGHAVATLGGEPYALLPLDEGQPPWHSVTPFRLGFLADRVDYSADEIVVHLDTDAGGSDNERHTRVIILPRRPAPEQVSQPATRIGSVTWPGVEGTETVRRVVARAISFCGMANSCVCVSYAKYNKKTGTTSEHMTVSCPHADGGAGGGGAGGGGSRRTNPPRGPNVPTGNPLPPRDRVSLNAAKQRANQAMRDNEKCRDLFKGLRRDDWNEVMNGWNVWRSGEGVKQPGTTRVRCNEAGIPAWTITNQPTIFLCSRFAELPPVSAAVTVIHESLHTAGLPEKPPVATAETPSEINDRVRRACFGGGEE